jgi:hypothetical protein
MDNKKSLINTLLLKDRSSSDKEIKKYRDDLKSKTEEELSELLSLELDKERQKKEQEELERFYNQSISILDLIYYCRKPKWCNEEATAILLNRNPSQVFWDRIAGYKHTSSFVQEYYKLKNLIDLAISHYEIYSDKKPIYFIEWAKKKDISFLPELESLVTKYNIDKYNIDLEVKYNKLKLENEKLTLELAEKPLHDTSKKSYQKLIAGLVRLKYPSSDNSINASNIANILSELDLPFDMISEDTIRDILKPCKALLKIIEDNHSKKTKNIKK